jgi:hypothetical protein
LLRSVQLDVVLVREQSGALSSIATEPFIELPVYRALALYVSTKVMGRDHCRSSGRVMATDAVLFLSRLAKLPERSMLWCVTKWEKQQWYDNVNDNQSADRKKKSTVVTRGPLKGAGESPHSKGARILRNIDQLGYE